MNVGDVLYFYVEDNDTGYGGNRFFVVMSIVDNNVMLFGLTTTEHMIIPNENGIEVFLFYKIPNNEPMQLKTSYVDPRKTQYVTLSQLQECGYHWMGVLSMIEVQRILRWSIRYAKTIRNIIERSGYKIAKNTP